MPNDSITAWVNQLRGGDEEAARRLWEAYFGRLVGMARQRLAQRRFLVGDEEDVALSAFTSFCRGLRGGEFAGLADRDDLWKLLVTITLHKALHLVRDEGRVKRGGGWQRVGGGGELEGEPNDDRLQRIVGAEPSPAVAAQIAEEAERMLASLGDSELIELAVLKMEGHSNAEIAARWNKTERTVERKLSLIRKIWQASAPPEGALD